jgi:sporulation protein YlmC with PRC-barrel domain
MLRQVKELVGYKLSATDGDIGKTKDLLFDDRFWVIRYLVAETGGWLSDRKVVIPRVVLGEPKWATREFPVGLSKRQVEESPPISEHEPVSRQHESSLHEYLRIDPYWMGEPRGAFVVAERAATLKGKVSESSPAEKHKEGDPHLRSCMRITGYHIQASDGEIGHVEDFIVDDDKWVIRYLVVDPHNVIPGRKVLIAVPWIDKINWSGTKVRVGLTRELVKNAPEFDPNAPVNRRVEERLYDYYGRPSYWA